MARVVEGFGLCVARPVYEERLKPEAPGTEACFSGRLVVYAEPRSRQFTLPAVRRCAA